MTYGDGSGTYFDVLTSIDVAAHELDMLFVKKQQTYTKKNQEQ
jgi:Zn-dependent metalloprotease